MAVGGIDGEGRRVPGDPPHVRGVRQAREIFTLRKKDLTQSQALGQSWAINLHPSENLEASKVDVSNETILLNSFELPWLGRALQCAAQLPQGPLFQYPELHATWQKALKTIGLPENQPCCTKFATQEQAGIV